MSSRSSIAHTTGTTSSARVSRIGSRHPEKRWKFQIGDLDDRRHWDEYAAAYEDAIRETSTRWAPWYVVPADHNWAGNLAVAQILALMLERLDPQLPALDPALDDLEVT